MSWRTLFRRGSGKNLSPSRHDSQVSNGQGIVDPKKRTTTEFQPASRFEVLLRENRALFELLWQHRVDFTKEALQACRQEAERLVEEATAQDGLYKLIIPHAEMYRGCLVPKEVWNPNVTHPVALEQMVMRQLPIQSTPLQKELSLFSYHNDQSVAERTDYERKHPFSAMLARYYFATTDSQRKEIAQNLRFALADLGNTLFEQQRHPFVQKLVKAFTTDYLQEENSRRVGYKRVDRRVIEAGQSSRENPYPVELQRRFGLVAESLTNMVRALTNTPEDVPGFREDAAVLSTAPEKRTAIDDCVSATIASKLRNNDYWAGCLEPQAVVLSQSYGLAPVITWLGRETASCLPFIMKEQVQDATASYLDRLTATRFIL